jgi:PAS domain S-box-containing protein
MTKHERKRLGTVRLFEQLNFSKNKELTDLVTLAAEICKVPIAMITLMGEDIQWIKCKLGVDIDSAGRETSFCKYLIDRDDVLVIPDARLDDRFKNNPAVTGDYAIRFYAGAPLITSTGLHVGSLCVFDQKPHSFTARQKEMLMILSAQAMHLMELEMSLKLIGQHNVELKRQKEKIDASERKLRAFFNSSPFCHILISRDFNVIDFNKATAVFIKNMYNKQVQAGKNVLNYISLAYRDEFTRCLKRAFAGKRSNKEVLIKFEGKGSMWWNIFLEPIKDEHGNVVSVVYNATNINEQKLQVAEISAQNESLLNIANIQSHEYRRPVASILGLMNLIKEDDSYLYNEYLMMMDKAVKELDEKICNVVKHTEVISAGHIVQQ